MSNRLLILVVGIIAVFAFIYSLDRGDLSSGETATGLEIAAVAAQFVDAALDENTGYFRLTYECNEGEGVCTVADAPDEVPHSGYATLSLKEVGERTGNAGLSQKADRVLDRVIERCESDSRFCEWNFFPLYEYFKRTKDEKYLDAMLEIESELLKERSFKDLLDNNIPIKLQRLYDATGEDRYRDRLVVLAERELKERTAQKELGKTMYTTDAGYEVRSYDTSVIWALYLPAYLASEDLRYLQFATEFFAAADIESNTNFFWGTKDTASLTKGLEAMLTIAQHDVVLRDEYRAKVKSALEAILRDRWDTPNSVKFNGDYGFIIAPTRKATNLQGWIITLFLSLESETFSL